MKKLLLTVTIVISVVSLNAQFAYDYLKAADEYFRKADYYSAAQYYEKYLAGGKGKTNGEAYNPYSLHKNTGAKKPTGKVSSREQAIYNLAESYRQLHFHVKAEPYYEQALAFDAAAFPLARYWHATTKRALAKYAEAEQGFIAFLDGYKMNDIYATAAKREIESLRFVQAQLNRKDLNLYSVAKAADQLNDTGATYAPTWMNNSTLLFTSTRPDKSASKTDVFTNRIYQAVYTDDTLSSIDKTAMPQLKDVHQGVVSVTPDGNTIFLTRWTIGEGKKTASLYSSSKTANGWSEPALLDGSINADNANTQQPFVMPDGQHLIFASDRAGGKGGFDLYAATLDANGKPGNVVNLGTTINTEFDEQAPFYHSASNTLVFSSNGRVGMGGYDFFYSKGNVNNWAEPKNFGYPVNSVKDDIYFTSRGGAKNILEDVLFSSDRLAACCLELFALNKQRPLKEISGLVLACDTKLPIAGATVNIVDTINHVTVTTRTTDASGRYTFTLEEYQPLKAVATNEGYFTSNIFFNAPQDTEELALANPDICLTLIPVEKPIVVENVYYDFNKATLREESFPALDELVTLLNDNPTIRIELGAHTDNIGKHAYNQTLSEARAKSVVNYLVSKGISVDRLQFKGYAATQPVAPNQNADGTDNPEGRQMNRRTEFKVLKN